MRLSERLMTSHQVCGRAERDHERVLADGQRISRFSTACGSSSAMSAGMRAATACARSDRGLAGQPPVPRANVLEAPGKDHVRGGLRAVRDRPRLFLVAPRRQPEAHPKPGRFLSLRRLVPRDGLGIWGHEQPVDRQVEVEALVAHGTRNDAGHPLAEQLPAQVEGQGLAVADREAADSIRSRPARAEPDDASRQHPGEPRRRRVAGRPRRPRRAGAPRGPERAESLRRDTERRPPTGRRGLKP